jgi:hypothetical protein
MEDMVRAGDVASVQNYAADKYVSALQPQQEAFHSSGKQLIDRTRGLLMQIMAAH